MWIILSETCIGRERMGLPENGKQNKFPSRDPPLAETAGAISSLNEAWFHTLDRCVTDSPLGEIILPLMRDCFFGRGDASGSLDAEGSWRAARLRYCPLHYGSAGHSRSRIGTIFNRDPPRAARSLTQSPASHRNSCLPLMRTPTGAVAPNSGVQRGPVNEEF